MKTRSIVRMAVAVGAALGLEIGAPGILGAEETELDRYVAAPDPDYRYELLSNHTEDVGTTYTIRFTSQRWLTEAEVDQPEWWHWLTIFRPARITGEAALLFITGGSTEKKEPREPDKNLERIAQATGSVVAELRMVPNQPLVFNGDGKERFEDDLIAYGWDKFLRGGDVKWLARLPMTKSAVRAMDTISEFLAQPERGGLKVEKFVVAGASKRGWTTWTTAAVDPRVVGIAPIVIDMLNVVPSFRHHWEAYGFYAPAVADYVEHGIMEWQDTPEYERLRKIVEPFEYRDRLTMPKLLINATGDQFFLPDSHRFYFDALKGPKYVRYVPNADHSLRDTDAPETLAAWQYALAHGKALPEFSWSIDWKAGEIAVMLEDRPRELALWEATNPEARDFRVETLGKAWTSRQLEIDDSGVVRVRVDKPERGWTAFMVEATYAIDGSPAPLKLTSGVAVVPDVLPFAGQMPKPRPPVR